jgi:hypothetical protein
MNSFAYTLMSFFSLLWTTATTDDNEILSGLVPGVEYDPITMVAR